MSERFEDIWFQYIEITGKHQIDCFTYATIAEDVVVGVVGRPESLISSAECPKMNMFSLPTSLPFHGSAIHGPDCQRAIAHELHVAVPEASKPAVDICSERSEAGMIFSAIVTR